MSQLKQLANFEQRVSDHSITHVSFDVFDTLICRPTRKPDDMYLVIGAACAGFLDLDAIAFARLRRRAENEARVKARFNGQDEVTLRAIYETAFDLGGLSREHLDEAIRREEAVEAANFFSSDLGLKLVTAARKAKKNIVFLSDTYYGVDFMTEALSAFFEKGDQLIVSSVELRTKHNGRLFQHALSEHGLRNVLHVGDNIGSDIRNALRVGLNVFHVRSSNELARLDGYLLAHEPGDLPLSIAQGVINYRLLQSEGQEGYETRLQTIGYNTLGPFWLGFCDFIQEAVAKERVEKLFFLSRDGFILKRAFEVFTEEDAEYLCVSRHTLYLAYAHLDFESAFDLLLQNYSQATINEVIGRLMPPGTDLETENLPPWAIAVLKKRVINEQTLAELKRVARVVTHLIKSNAATQFQNIKTYFESLGIQALSRIAIVDIGWHGSMQVFLQKLFQGMGWNVKIVGLYAGLYAHAKRPVGNDTMTAYLFEYGDRAHIEKMVQCGPSTLEVLHSAPHGTTLGYHINSEKVTPIFADAKAEILQYGRFVQHFQKGGLAFIDDFKASHQKVLSRQPISGELLKIAYASNLLRLVSRPTEEEASFVSLLGLHPDFGPSDEIILLVEEGGNGKSSMWPIGRSHTYRARIPEWFDEDHYLDARPDVLDAVQKGEFACGYEHFMKHGKEEEAPK